MSIECKICHARSISARSFCLVSLSLDPLQLCTAHLSNSHRKHKLYVLGILIAGSVSATYSPVLFGAGSLLPFQVCHRVQAGLSRARFRCLFVRLVISSVVALVRNPESIDVQV